MSSDEIKDRLKQILYDERLSWEKLSDKIEESSGIKNNRSSLRRNLLGWLDKANTILNEIGYEIKIVRKKKS